MTHKSSHIIISFAETEDGLKSKVEQKMERLIQSGLYGETTEEVGEQLILSELRRLFPVSRP